MLAPCEGNKQDSMHNSVFELTSNCHICEITEDTDARDQEQVVSKMSFIQTSASQNIKYKKTKKKTLNACGRWIRAGKTNQTKRVIV